MSVPKFIANGQQVPLHTLGSAEVAGHIAADFNVNQRRRLQAVMGIKARYLMDGVQRHIESLRQGLQLLLSQIAATFLNVV